MVYIDTNMVRAGAVNHPSMWHFCGYNGNGVKSALDSPFEKD